MKLNGLKNLIFVFLVLLAGVIGLYIYDRTQQVTDTTIAVEKTALFNTLNMDALNKITVKTKTATVELTLEDNNWKANGKKADQNQVKSFIEELKNTKLYDLVSKNPENQKDLGVDEENGKELTVEQGSGKVSVVVGSTAGAGTTFYIKKQGENEVYLSRGNLGSMISAEINSWRDKNIANVDFEKLAKIEVTGNKNFTVSKNAEAKWIKAQARKDTEVSEENINTLKTTFSPLDSFAFSTEEEMKTYGSTKQKFTVRLVDAENNELAKFETAKIEDNYFVKSGNETDLFKVYGSKLNFLFESL